MKAKQGKKSDKKKKQSIKQLKFLKYFIRSGNKRESAKKAFNIGSRQGSKTRKQANKTADTLGSRTYQQVRTKLEQIYKENKIDIDWVLKRIVYEAETSKQPQIRLRALELIGKHFAMFTDKIEHTGKERVIKIYIPDNKRGKNLKDIIPEKEKSESESEKVTH